MANSALPKAIPDIPNHCTAFIGSLVIPVQFPQLRPDADLSLMTPQPGLESNGRWMSNIFRQPAIPAPYRKNSTSIW